MQARIIGENSMAALLFNDSKASSDTLAVLSNSHSIEAAGVFTADGKLLASFQRDDSAPVGTPPPQLIDAGHRFGLDHLELVRKVDAGNRTIGLVVVRAGLHQLHRHVAGYAALTLAVAYLLVARMRSVVRKAKAHLDYLAHIDSVTDLPNRHAFNERLALAIAKADRFGGKVELLLLDLDNFKMVNDTLGHPAGDALLKLVGQRLVGGLRASDIICRTGGNEFAIILEPIGRRNDIRETVVAEKILTVLGEPFVVDAHDIHVTASVGSSLYPDDARDVETLTRNADAAMYQAKNRGKNTFERNELLLYYQPQIAIADGSVAGVEALLRWKHPELGMIGPGDFIPIAEDSGLIVQIGRWALREAGCDVIQGYYFSRPCSAADVEAFLHERIVAADLKTPAIHR